jgi:hypothetical protein
LKNGFTPLDAIKNTSNQFHYCYDRRLRVKDSEARGGATRDDEREEIGG